MMEQPQTNHQASFCQTPSSPDERSGAYNKLEAVKAINGSSIRVDDYTTAAREYFSTTTSDTYRHPPKSGDYSYSTLYIHVHVQVPTALAYTCTCIYS